jgi:hypothetical protein
MNCNWKHNFSVTAWLCFQLFANWQSRRIVVKKGIIFSMKAVEKQLPLLISGNIKNQSLANLHQFLPQEALATLWKNLLES